MVLTTSCSSCLGGFELLFFRSLSNEATLLTDDAPNFTLVIIFIKFRFAYRQFPFCLTLVWPNNSSTLLKLFAAQLLKTSSNHKLLSQEDYNRFLCRFELNTRRLSFKTMEISKSSIKRKYCKFDLILRLPDSSILYQNISGIIIMYA